MKKIIIALFCLLLAVSVFGQKPKPKTKSLSKTPAPKIVDTKDEAQLVMLAITAFKEGKYAAAKIYLTRILEITPDAVSYSLRATISGLEGNTRGEITDYYQALNYSFADVEAHWKGGFAFGAKRDADATIATITKFVKTNPDSAEAFAVRGWAYRVKGNISSKIPEAVADFSKAIELKPNEPLFYYLRGEAEIHQNNPQKASVDFTKYLKANPDDENVIGLRSNAFLRIGNFEGAIADINELIKRNPNNFTYLNQRARTYGEMENYEKAIADYNTIIKAQPENTFAIFFRADSYEKAGNFQKAVEDHTELIRLQPKDIGNYYRRADCYKKMKNKVKALEDYRYILKIEPENEMAKENINELEKEN